MSDEKCEYTVDLEKLELNGRSIVELLEFDPDVSEEEFGAMFKAKALELREMGLVEWPDDDAARIFAGRDGTFRVRTKVGLECMFDEQFKVVTLTAHAEEGTVFIPPLKPGVSVGKKARKALGWAEADTKILGAIASTWMDGIQVLVDFKQRDDSRVRFMREYEKGDDGYVLRKGN